MVKTLVKEVAENLYLLRLDDNEIKYFEALWHIPEGITYNAYLYLGPNTRILFDTWKIGFSSLFIETLRSLVEPKDIDVIIVHHMEPDHSGALKSLVELNPDIKVFGHPLVKNMIESFYGIENIVFRPVRDLEEISIKDIKLKFIYTPWLHWPETIMSYLYSTKTLFTGDVFGAFSIPSSVFGEELTQDYINSMRKYFVDVIGYYRQHVEKNIKKILDLGLDIELVAPLHGALWKDIGRIAEYYIKWGRGEGVENKVTVIYSSMYGFVEKAIQFAIELLRSLNVNVVVYKITDNHRSEISDILNDTIDSSAVILGTATYEAGIFPYMEFIVNQLAKKANSPKPVIIISSYGWGGVAGKFISNMLSKTKFKVLRIIEYKGMLTEDTLKDISDAVNELVKYVKT